ncbi:MAG: uroporphyrinogen-III C-methyltransferase [Pseudomonadales bacterium]|nr:uroporphyrinogen-III C-methyltransferase [Pseudomonadales bacterium]
MSKTQTGAGIVWLVGAGPGDPDLLTLKALRLIQRADVVIYDRLVSADIMALIPAATRKVYVGKARSEHAVPQDDINQLLVEEARAGHKVLRLKGGDPFIFGRGGEEIEQLAAVGIPFEVVPGITAASGCAAYAGIPLTHRDYAQSVRFITGHLKNDGVNLHWPELMDPTQTLVFYMGLVGLQAICEQLIQHGRDPHTPVALIEKGTTPQQRVVIATLATINERVHAEQVTAPTLTIIGDVVKLHEKLHWR